MPAHFSPDMFKFLRQLKRNNTREWFNANKPRYIEVVRDPMLRFVEDLGPRLAKVSPHFVADPSASGGSMFRIYRDTRFAKDKSPYKTSCSAQFRHENGKDVHAPGFYLHLEPGEVFVGCGIWHPDGPSLKGIRDAIVDESARWKRITGAKAFKEGRLTIAGESLKRPPRGYDAEHPLVEDLKRKDFITITKLDEKAACSATFMNEFVKTCRTGMPFVGFIADALGFES